MELSTSCVGLTGRDLVQGCDCQGMIENLEGHGGTWTGDQEILFLLLTCGTTSDESVVPLAV